MEPRGRLVLLALLFSLAAGASSSQAKAGQEESPAQSCQDCRLASASIEKIIREPRHVDAQGQAADRIDLDKIKRAVCKDLANDSSRQRCRHFFYANIKSVERWKQLTNGRSSFFDYVCIRELKLCCPRNSFGPKCKKCPDCSANEQCSGEGTRSGSGACICKAGHSGPSCSTCLAGYFALQSTGEFSNGTSCVRCDPSCRVCRQIGPLGCEVCADGFRWSAGYGCIDVDECLESGNKICGTNTFCVNTIGSYFCYECDRACNGCHADGPDACLRCAEGYRKEDGNCVAKSAKTLLAEGAHYRYGIYAGLGLCACIILYNNVYLAGIVGLVVALYIGFSEYTLKNLDDHVPKVDYSNIKF